MLKSCCCFFSNTNHSHFFLTCTLAVGSVRINSLINKHKKISTWAILYQLASSCCMQEKKGLCRAALCESTYITHSEILSLASLSSSTDQWMCPALSNQIILLLIIIHKYFIEDLPVPDFFLKNFLFVSLLVSEDLNLDITVAYFVIIKLKNLCILCNLKLC